ncbi:HTH_48 domain-containing protein, partial [Trichonephila clavipes]
VDSFTDTVEAVTGTGEVDTGTGEEDKKLLSFLFAQTRSFFSRSSTRCDIRLKFSATPSILSLDEERSGRPSVINDDLVELVWQRVMENRRFTITGLSSHFPQISRSLLHEIVTKHLLFKKLCVRWVQKDLTPEHTIHRLGAALIFLQW